MIRVLLVDDSKFVTRTLSNILEAMDFQVLGVAHDGHEGIQQYQQLHPDVTLLDLTMPNMDGLECLNGILNLDPEARVVMLSAIQDPDTVAKCLERGACSFLQKPIRQGSPADLSRLCGTLEAAVAKVA